MKTPAASYTFLTLVVLAATHVLSASVPAKNASEEPSGMITIPIVRHSSKRQSSVKSMINAAARFNPTVKQFLHARRDSSSLKDFSDEFYSCEMKLGNGQTFTVDLDTGSSDTWIRGPNCVSEDGSCGGEGQATVDIVNDRTIRSTRSSFAVQYGSGRLKGEIWAGPVSIGSLKADINFGVSTEETGFNFEADGLMGLAFPTINEIQGGNFFQHLNLHGNQNQFAFYLSNSVDGDRGEVTFGGYDKSKFTGPITYLPLNSNTYWQFSADGGSFAVGGKKLGRLSGNYISDTGTSLTLLPAKVAKAINKMIGAKDYDESQGIFPIDCKVAHSGPDVTLSFGSGHFSIPAAVYVLSNGGTCFSGFTANFDEDPSAVNILGDSFLRAYYSIYDVENNRVGFAKAVHRR